MLRLLIVDDEPIIADGLHELFSTNYPDSLEVLRVYSAQEAIAILNRARIDIIISDIEMPKMDGIALMNEVRSRWSYCRVIFLTGYDRFNYAYKAITGGVSAFILKTEPDEIILEAVDNCIAEIKNENNNEEFLQRLQSELDEARILTRREYLQNFLKGKTNPEVFLGRLLDSGIPLQGKRNCMLVCGKINRVQGVDKISEKQAKIKTLFYQYTRSIGDGFLFFENSDNLLYAVIQPHKTNPNTTIMICEALEHMQDACVSVTGLEVSFIVDNDVVAWGNLPARYNRLSHYLQYWMENQSTPKVFQAVYFSQLTDESHIADLRSRSTRADMINNLLIALENNSVADYMEVIQQIKIMLADLEPNSLLRMEILGSVIVNLTATINKRQLESQMPTAMYQGLYSIFIRSADEVHECLRIFGEAMFKAAENIKYDKDEAFIQNLHKYINDHMAQSITLLQLAEFMHFNASYLSRLYKQITGNNLSDVILEIKMSRAQELIRLEPHLKINEVAEKTGFQYPAYFARIFKKHFGLTPQEYREMVS
jgi:two-component system response regulator YesN